MKLILSMAPLLLLGCDRSVSKSEAEAIAEDMADSHMRQLEVRIIELEQKIERAEKLQDPTSDYALALGNALDAERESRKSADDGLIKHYNDHLHRFHGAPKTAE
jgi:hypothetical protein